MKSSPYDRFRMHRKGAPVLLKNTERLEEYRRDAAVRLQESRLAMDGSSGPASECFRIDPVTGEKIVVGVTSRPRLTVDEVMAARGADGEWTPEQFAEWGVPYPPRRGWMRHLCGQRRRITG